MGDEGLPSTDAELVVASLREPPRFALLFDRHARAVHRYVASRVRLSDVDDVVSETFVIAFRTRYRYDPAYENARPWLLGIATNVLHQHRRSETRRLVRLRAFVHTSDSDVDLAESVSAAVDDAAESDRVFRALAHLGERHRDVLLLAASGDLSYEEIARALGIPIGTVRSRLSRARLRLRELLAPDGQYEDSTNHVMPSTEGTLG
jgi:RNA polymerase sigma factor (sigma-70 family)